MKVENNLHFSCLNLHLFQSYFALQIFSNLSNRIYLCLRTICHIVEWRINWTRKRRNYVVCASKMWIWLCKLLNILTKKKKEIHYLIMIVFASFSKIFAKTIYCYISAWYLTFRNSRFCYNGRIRNSTELISLTSEKRSEASENEKDGGPTRWIHRPICSTNYFASDVTAY